MIMDRVPTVGEKLRNRYLDSLNPDKKLEYKAKAKQFLENAVKDIQDNIDNNKPPVSTISSGKTQSGIVTTDNSLVELFQDFAFNVICSDMADEMGLKITFEIQPRVNPADPSKPILDIIMMTTFK